MEDERASQGENLAQAAQRQNSNLRRLIDAVGTLISGSRALLSRLQGLEEEKATGETKVELGNDGTDPGLSSPNQPPQSDQQKT